MKCPEFVRWTPEQCRYKFCPCPYPLCKVSKDESLDFILDLIDDYVSMREAVENEKGNIHTQQSL